MAAFHRTFFGDLHRRQTRKRPKSRIEVGLDALGNRAMHVDVDVLGYNNLKHNGILFSFLSLSLSLRVSEWPSKLVSGTKCDDVAVWCLPKA